MIHEINPIQKYTKPFKCCKYILPIFEMICQNNIINRTLNMVTVNNKTGTHYLKLYVYVITMQ